MRPIPHVLQIGGDGYQLKRSANCIWRGVPSWVFSLPKLDEDSVLLAEFPEPAPDAGSNRTLLVRL